MLYCHLSTAAQADRTTDCAEILAHFFVISADEAVLHVIPPPPLQTQIDGHEWPEDR